MIHLFVVVVCTNSPSRACPMDGRQETLVKDLHEFVFQSDRRIAELEYEKLQMSKRITHLESVLETKDKMLREYLRRVALLEFAVRKTKPPGAPTGYMLNGDPGAVGTPIPEGKRPSSFREVIRGYLAELGDLVTPGREERDAELGEERQVTVAVPQPSPAPVVVPEISSKQWQLERTISASLFAVNAVGVVNNQLLLSGSDEGLIKCWPKDSKDNTTASIVLRGHKGAVRCLSIKSTVCVSGGDDGKLIAWRVDPTALGKLEPYPSTSDLNTVTKPSILPNAHAGSICDIQFHPETSVLASGGADRAVCVWRVDHGGDDNFFLRDSSSSEPLKMWFRDLAAPPSVLSWYSADRNKLVAGMSDGSVTLFDVASEKLVTGIKAPSGQISVTAIVSGTDRLFIAYSNGHLRMIDLKSSSNVSSGLTIVGPGDYITCMSEYGTPLITGSAKGVVTTWDYRGGQHKTLSEFHAPGPVADMCMFGESLVTCGSDGKIFLYR